MSNKYQARMILEIDYEGDPRRYIVEVPNWDVTMSQVVDEMLRPLLLAAGFHPDAVEDLFAE